MEADVGFCNYVSIYRVYIDLLREDKLGVSRVPNRAYTEDTRVMQWRSALHLDHKHCKSHLLRLVSLICDGSVLDGLLVVE